MGNRIAIERKPIPLGVILKGGGGGGGGSGTIADNGVEGRVTNEEGRPTEGGGRSGNANGYNTTIEEEGPKKRGSYNSSLHVWRFFIDDNGSAEDSQVRHEPVFLNESFVFDRHQAYLALHIFSENAVTRSLKIRAAAAATPTNNIGDGGRANGAGGESNQSPTATIESLLSSSVEVFTPRGLASCLEEVFITSATDNNNFDDDSSTSSSRDLEGDAVTGNSSAAADSEEDEEGVLPPLAYNLYVWRGKDSLQLVQALALTKSFELEKALKKDGKRVLRRLFRGGDKVPLSSIFSCTHNNRHRQARATSTTLAGETAAAGDAEACASRRRSQRHDDDDDDDDSEEADVESDDEDDDDDEKPYSRQHHLYRQLLKRRRLTRRGAAGGEAGENPDGGSNGSVPKLSIPQVKNLFQAPVSPSRHGRSRSASALDAIINAVSIEEPAESSSPVPMVTTTTTTTSPAEGGGHLTLADLGPRPITKSSSLTMPVIPTSSGAKKGKLKLPPIKTGGVSLSGSVLAVPMNSFSLSDLQSMQDKEQGGDSDIFNRAEVNQRQDKLSKYDSICSKITDQVYLGSQTVSRDIAMLKQQGVTHILNCAGSICPEYHPNDFNYRTLYLMDGVREDITCMLYDVIEWMDNVITSNGKIFVHCQQGVSRSSAMTIGYLMWKNGWGFERTHMFVKERRGVSSPNTGFICQLLELAKRLSLARSGNSREGGLRLYQVVVHTENDPDFVVAKLARKENLVELQNAAPSSSCYILQSPDAFFIWVGAQCSERFVQVAQRTVQRVQRFENATKIVHVVTQGQETDDFRRHLQQFTLEEVT